MKTNDSFNPSGLHQRSLRIWLAILLLALVAAASVFTITHSRAVPAHAADTIAFYAYTPVGSYGVGVAGQSSCNIIVKPQTWTQTEVVGLDYGGGTETVYAYNNCTNKTVVKAWSVTPPATYTGKYCYINFQAGKISGC